MGFPRSRSCSTPIRLLISSSTDSASRQMAQGLSSEDTGGGTRSSTVYQALSTRSGSEVISADPY